jgi:hypothetical protein
LLKNTDHYKPLKVNIMKTKFLTVVLSIILSATVLSANAQKNYSEGIVTLKTSAGGQEVVLKQYFRNDSIATIFSAGPANIKLLADANYKSFAVIAEVDAFKVKKAAIYTADEIEKALSASPNSPSLHLPKQNRYLVLIVKRWWRPIARLKKLMISG